ncbi:MULTISPECIES: anti-sigma factor [Paraburkholderia]|jgi:anti-sigma factor RsiW|uniref:anti-sigma factor n=1 Tax=Paraburkholderia TaxID=1822464 RepID=UPI00225C27F0|nr:MULTISPECIES: anti-sigma factor [Paraburkholderia]MCX4157536.1 anti-sigma factor [Paraburkholderia aspalathi]MDN7166940.1 anti-sigma factor [Paraburkholderia sp. SECH2]MDQ6395426.1 anti-sigma factor [Paraburkholderia aspalathi]
MNNDHDSSLPEEPDLRALSAFVDGELPAGERAAIEAQLAQQPQAAARVAAWRAQKAALQALCGAPQRSERSERVGPSAGQSDADDEPAFIVVRRPTPWWQRVGLAACWLAAGAGIALALGPLAPRLTGGAWNGLGGQPPSFAERADIAYAVYTPERRHPVEVAANEEEHLINWLSKRLNRPLSVPSLQEYGYSLVGGRLLPGEAGPAAQFMYENTSGARLTLYITGIARDETAFRLFRDGNRRTFYWVSDRMGYALSGPISEDKLRSIAIEVCSALGGKPEAWQ